MAAPMLACLTVGIALRFLLYRTSVPGWLAEKNEISTPLTSWKRVTEGLALHREGISPYSGDIFHEMPLLLRLLNYLTNVFGPNLYWIFILMDLIVAVVLERIAKHCGKYLLIKQSQEVMHYSQESEKLILRAKDLTFTRFFVVAAYLFNPYSIACCLARSTAVFNNLTVAAAILFTLKGRRGAACLSIALASYLSLYPLMLIVPTAIFLAMNDKDGSREKGGDFTSKNAIGASLIQTFLCTAAALLGLLYLSFMLEKSWEFLGATYGFILSVPDLTPNIGLFWYFFTEMFEHFRLFFICVFQINAFIYTVPLAIKLKEHPIFQMYLLVAVMGIFKSYPSYADTSLYISMLPLWKHVFQYMRNNFVVSCMFLVCTVMAPIQWHLWIYAGSANANFYFAITLAYSAAQVFLITDLLFGFLRREYSLIHGSKPPVINGKEAQVILD